VAQLERYLAPLASEPSATALDEQALQRTVEENYREAKRKELTFMERLALWWDSLFESDNKPSGDPGFWRNLLPSELFARLLLYGMSGLLAALTLVYGWRELQPFLDARRGAVRLRAEASAKPTAAPWPPQLQGLAPHAALAQAFSALVALLTERKRLPSVPGLTHAELAAAFSPSASDASSAQFQAAANTASSVLFTQRSVPAAELAEFLARADAIAKERSGA
jgi:hypothetical protein